MIEDFRDVLTHLNASGARFIVVGAHALAAHGVPRVTGDLDILVDPEPTNARAVWQALVEFGAPLEALGIRSTDLETADRVIQLGLPPYRIDVLTGISAVTFDEAWAERIAGTLFEVPVSFLGRMAFLRNKRASGRPKDLEDIRALGG